MFASSASLGVNLEVRAMLIENSIRRPRIDSSPEPACEGPLARKRRLARNRQRRRRRKLIMSEDPQFARALSGGESLGAYGYAATVGVVRDDQQNMYITTIMTIDNTLSVTVI